MRPPARQLCVGIAVLLVLGGATVGPAVAVSGDQVGGTHPSIGEPHRAAQETPTNNTSVRHEDPRDTGESGDIGAIRSHLAGVMLGRLGSSVITLSQGEYELTKQYVGPEYRSALEKYVDVDGETDETFERAADQQREFTNETQAYRETYQEYQEAKQNGNERRARELARKLTRLEEDVTTTGDVLEGSIATLGNETGRNVTATLTAIQQIQQNISELQAEVVEAEFVRTSLSLEAIGQEVSFLDPLTLEGRLVTENGTALANRTVVIDIAGRTHEVRTDADGRFTVEYRPVTLPLATESVTARYQPAAESIYLGSNATVPVRVRQTNATITITEVTDTARFGDKVTIRGQIVANGLPVAGAPISVSIAGVNVGITKAGKNGTFSFSMRLPATIPDGRQPLSTSFALSDRAVTGSPDTSTIAVDSTETRMELDATAPEQTVVQVQGTLTTEEGDPIPNQSVHITVDGSTVATLRTDAAGTYSGKVSIPSSLSGTVTVTSEFTGTGTNLNASSAAVRVNIPQTEVHGQGQGQEVDEKQHQNPLQGPFLPIPWPVALAVGVLLLSLLGIAGVVRWSRGSSQESAHQEPESPKSSPEPTPERLPGENLMEAATTLLEEGEIDAAVETAYAAARRALVNRYELADRGTHTEFLAGATDVLEEAESDRLAALTETYEVASYGPATLDETSATNALTEARELVQSQTSE